MDHTAPEPAQPIDATEGRPLALPPAPRLPVKSTQFSESAIVNSDDEKSTFPPLVQSNTIVGHLEHVFSGAAQALSSHVNGAHQPQTFALQSHAYYNLESYLKVGVDLPSSIPSFEQLFPKDELADLTKREPQIYNVCSNGFIDPEVLADATYL